MFKPLPLLPSCLWIAAAMTAGTAPARADDAAPADEAYETARPQMLEEIVVTATKRETTLQDVAVAVSAITGDSIEKRGFNSMADYLTKLPAVTIQDRGPGRNQIVIRGVASEAGGFADDTVGVYIGEVAMSSGLAFASLGYPDLRLYDVNRVEVLRGPQGTLYGSGSMGGTVRIVPNDPVLDQFQVRADTGVSRTRHGATNYELGASFNIPVADRLAFRVAGYRNEHSGFIDNRFPGNDFSAPQDALGGASLQDLGVPDPGIGAREAAGANDVATDGLRLAATMVLHDSLTLTASYLHQKSGAGGLPEVDASIDGRHAQARFTAEELEDRFDLFNLLLSWSGTRFELTSSTGYMDRYITQARDVSAFFLTAPLFLDDTNSTENLSQEIRLTSSDDSRLQWLGGIYYQRLKGNGRQNFQWRGNQESLTGFMDNVIFGSETGLTLDSDLYTRDDEATEDQYALFGELAYELTERFRTKIGGRWFRYEQDFDGFQDGAFVGGTPLGGEPQVEVLNNKESGFNPMAGIEFRPGPGQLYYAQAAQGFRLGGPQAGVPAEAPGCADELDAIGITPEQTRQGIKSDQLWSYEAGGKLSLADGRASLNAAVYYIDWKDIPVNFLLSCGFPFSANAGKASSKGAEVEFAASLPWNLVLAMSGSWVDATLEEDIPAETGIAGVAGDRLPGIPRWNFQTSLQYDTNILARSSFLRIDYSYVGSFHNRFPGDPGNARSGDYSLVDLRAGIELSDELSLELFAQNLTNESVNLLVDTEIGDGRTLIGRPRTIGLALRTRF